MPRLRRTRTHHANKNGVRKPYGVQHRTKDFDQIVDDLKPENVEKFDDLPFDEDLPGCGQYYCVSCARYFVTPKAHEEHNGTRVHKRAVARAGKDKPWTVEDGLAMKVDNGDKLNRAPPKAVDPQMEQLLSIPPPVVKVSL